MWAIIEMFIVGHRLVFSVVPGFVLLIRFYHEISLALSISECQVY